MKTFMHCPESPDIFNRLLDGELPPFERDALEEHLLYCDGCQASFQELMLADAFLWRAFASRRRAAAALADHVIDRLRRERQKQRWLADWTVPLASAAAGFLLAIIVLRWPFDLERAQTTKLTIARLALATGPTEVRSPPAVNWFTCPTNGTIQKGAEVRTGDHACCEIETNDSVQLRLDRRTVVELPNPQCVRLTEGEVYSAIPSNGKEFRLELPDAVVEAAQGKFDVSCSPGKASLTVVEGSANLSCRNGSRRVVAGENVRVVGGNAEQPSTVVDPLQVTAWVNELLVLKEPENPELTERLNDILAQIGHTKVSHLYENEIRRLGSRAALPLLRYVESPRSQPDKASRVAAARIAGDLANEEVIGVLISLLADDDPQVRFHAARALERLTGTNHGRAPEAWQNDPQSCEPTREAWKEWWQSRSTKRNLSP